MRPESQQGSIEQETVAILSPSTGAWMAAFSFSGASHMTVFEREPSALDSRDATGALPPHLVVIGNGMAGCRAVEELLARDGGRFRVTIFGAEPHVNYNRIMLSPVLAGEKTFEEIIINTREWYDAHGIDLVTLAEAIGTLIVAVAGQVSAADEGADATFQFHLDAAVIDFRNRTGDDLVLLQGAA